MLLCVGSGACLAVHFTTYFASIYLTSIAASTVLVNTEVFYVSLLGLVILGQRVRPLGWLGIALTFAGSCLIAFADAGSGSNILLGDGLALLGALAASGYTLAQAPPESADAVSTESVKRRFMSGRMTRRSTTISILCLMFLSS